MREEYAIYIRLCHDKSFLTRFFENRKETIMSEYPEADVELFTNSTATKHGLEEEYYKRLYNLQGCSRDIFGECHYLILALYGDLFFEDILTHFYNTKFKPELFSGKQEIIEPFDGYVIGPYIMNVLVNMQTKDSWWLTPLLNYKWGLWQANRVALGFPPLYKVKNMKDGTTFIEADFDLPALLNEVNRLDGNSVSYDLFRKRIIPKKGYYACLIFIEGQRVLTAKLNRKSADQTKKVISAGTIEEVDDKKSLDQLSFVLSNSFLCCTSEFCDKSLLEEKLSQQTRPEPH
jgi:hypothetical protein